jgi:hypothetical protein
MRRKFLVLHVFMSLPELLRLRVAACATAIALAHACRRSEVRVINLKKFVRKMNRTF